MDVAAGAGAVWVANAAPGLDSVLPQSISRLDPETGQEIARIELRASPGGHQYGVLPGVSRQHVAVTHDAVWVINADQSVTRIDPRTNRVAAVVEGVKARNITAGEGRIWITEDDAIREIDPVRNAVSKPIAVGGDTLSGIAAGAGAVWVADPFQGKVWRVETEPKVVKTAIELDTWVAGLAFGEGALWATNELADLVYRIDPRTLRARVIRGTPAPRGVATGDGAVWVAASSPPSPDAALPPAVCATSSTADREPRTCCSSPICHSSRRTPDHGRSHSCVASRSLSSSASTRQARSPWATGRATRRPRTLALRTSFAAARTPRPTHATSRSSASSVPSSRPARTSRSPSRTPRRTERSR